MIKQCSRCCQVRVQEHETVDSRNQDLTVLTDRN